MARVRGSERGATGALRGSWSDCSLRQIIYYACSMWIGETTTTNKSFTIALGCRGLEPMFSHSVSYLGVGLDWDGLLLDCSREMREHGAVDSILV
jgi:hypothetical protein